MISEHSRNELIRRIQHGDRDALGEFVIRYGPLIRRRIAGKLGPRMRRVMDSADILSTVLRRLDLYAHGHSIRAGSEAELWALIMRVADAAVLQKLRLVSRLGRVESEDAPLAAQMLTRLRAGSNDESHDHERLIDRSFAAIEPREDQTILWLWLSGMELRMIASIIGRTPESTRKRWELIRKRVRATLEEGGAEDERVRSQHA